MDPKILQSSLYNRGYDLPKSVNSFFKFDGVVGDETKQAYNDWKQKAMKTSMLSASNNYEPQDNTKVAPPIINKAVIAPKMAVQKPGQSVALPAEFKKGGKTNIPIYVNDPKDPRLQMYSDSLSNYNKNEIFFKDYQPLTPAIAEQIKTSYQSGFKDNNLNYQPQVIPPAKKPEQSVSKPVIKKSNIKIVPGGYKNGGKTKKSNWQIIEY
jgi:hypothetical protein